MYNPNQLYFFMTIASCTTSTSCTLSIF